MTKKELLYKIKNKIKFTEEEVMEIITFKSKLFSSKDLEYVDYNPQENRRWSRSVNLVYQVDDINFMLSFEEGLTEYQENDYFEQVAIIVEKDYVLKKVWKEKGEK